jgi:hypothetical protein
VTPPQPDGYSYDGLDARALWEWVIERVGPGQCNYVWAGVRGWHVTVNTTHGHQTVRAGDLVQVVGPGQLGVVPMEERA